MATKTWYSKAQADTLFGTKADLVGGVIPTSQIPAIALTSTVVVGSQAAMLALSAVQVQIGDIAVRTDGAGTFVLAGVDPSQLTSWTRLNAPTDVVQSVNGQQGTVVLAAADVGAATPASVTSAVAAVTPTSLGLGNVSNTSDSSKPISTAQQAAFDALFTSPAQIVPVGYYAMPASGNVGTLALSLNAPIATPLVIAQPSMTFDSIGINVVTAGATGSVVRLAIFASDASGFPLAAGGNILQTAALASTATGIISQAQTFTLTRGIYWVAVVAQGAVCSVESVTSVFPNLPRPDGSYTTGLTTSTVSGTFFSGYVPSGGAGSGPRVRLHRSA